MARLVLSEEDAQTACKVTDVLTWSASRRLPYSDKQRAACVAMQQQEERPVPKVRVRKLQGAAVVLASVVGADGSPESPLCKRLQHGKQLMTRLLAAGVLTHGGLVVKAEVRG